MKISQGVFTIHQLTGADVEALSGAYNLVEEIYEKYDPRCVIMSPNDGECVEVHELARVKGILSFLLCNRVVEIDCKS